MLAGVLVKLLKRCSAARGHRASPVGSNGTVPPCCPAGLLVAERDGFPWHEAVLQEDATKRAELGYDTE